MFNFKVKPATQAGAKPSGLPSVGSLFVPTRPPQQTSAKDVAPSVCRVASGLEQPMDVQRLGQLLLPSKPAVQQPVTGARAGAKPSLFLSWAGSGIFFWWQLGAVQYLMERYDLSKVPMAGASGGGLAATLSTCGVSTVDVMDSAYEMSMHHEIWERPMRLMGMWGSLIEAWLDALLPADAAERCRGQTDIIITQLPFCNQVAISDFMDKQDLINVAMASAHVPLVLDGKLTRDCRGVASVDGSVPDFFAGNCDLLMRGGDAVLFDYFLDPKLVRKGRMDMLEVKSINEIRRIMRLGYKYAHKLHMDGTFGRFDCSRVAFERVRRTPTSSAAAKAASGATAGAAMPGMQKNNVVPAPARRAAVVEPSAHVA